MVNSSKEEIALMLKDCIHRLEPIESNSLAIESIMDTALSRWGVETDSSEKILMMLRSDFEETQAEFRKNVSLFLSTVEAFKNCASREQFVRLETKIDRFSPETFVSKAEFRKLVKRYLAFVES